MNAAEVLKLRDGAERLKCWRRGRRCPVRPAVRSEVRPLLSEGPLGFGPRWVVRHADPCGPSGGADHPHSRAGSRAPARAACRAFAPGEYRSLRRRLDRWELEHLRAHSADLVEQLEVERRAREHAEDSAEFWREQALSVELRDGERLGVAVDGTLHVVAAGEKGGAA